MNEVIDHGHEREAVDTAQNHSNLTPSLSNHFSSASQTMDVKMTGSGK